MTTDQLTHLIDMRSGSASEQEMYYEAFKNESRFVCFKNEFIPVKLFSGSESKNIIKKFGKGVVDNAIDLELAKFYKQHKIKRDINNIADSITYIFVDETDQIDDVTPGFMDVKMIASLCKYQGRTYKATDQTLKAIGQKMGEHVLQPTNHWLEKLPFPQYQKEPERYWQVAGAFKQYTWGKLFYPEHIDKKVFLTVGINLKNGTLFYGLDCLRAGTQKLSTDQILMFEHFTKDKKVMKTLLLTDISGMTWKKLLKKSTKFLEELAPVYHDTIDYIWGNNVDVTSLSHQVVRVKPDMQFFSKEGMQSSSSLQETAIELVMDYERDTLEFLGKPQLSGAIKALANESGTNVYDVHSFNTDGSDKYIKVIASNNNSITGFPFTDTDVERSNENTDKSYLYCVFNLSEETKSGHLVIQKGPYDKLLSLKAVVYTVA